MNAKSPTRSISDAGGGDKGRGDVNDKRKPVFLITIDTEEDNAWVPSPVVTTENAAYLPRFQRLCERYGFRPTYLTTPDMANSGVFREFAKDVIARDVGEIGMHLHAWSSSPEHKLTNSDWRHCPYLIEYPPEVVREKVLRATRCLEENFGKKMASHRAGRWSFNEIYAKALIDLGYLADCSVTPLVTWKETSGSPTGSGGTDFRRFPDTAYFIDPENIARSGSSPLLEIPVSIVKAWGGPVDVLRFALPLGSFFRRCLDRFLPSVYWLSPNKYDLPRMLRLVRRAERSKREYIEMAFHSSELMPGCSPTFPTHDLIERLYDHMEELFETIARTFYGATVAEYRARFDASAEG